MKRPLLFLLACAAVLVATAVTAGATGTTEPEGPMEITWLMQLNQGETTTWFIEELNKKFNVKIKPNGISPQNNDPINVMLAAGEMPDTAFMMAQDPKKLYSEGVIRGIPVALIRKNMPNYTKTLDSKYPTGWLMNVNPDNKDERLALTSLLYYSDSILMGLLEFRIDQARKVGFDLPDYDTKKRSLDNFGRCYFLDYSVTMEWLEKLLIAFRDKDPDGNGKNDTIPWATCSDKNWSFVNIYGSFGLAPGYTRLVNGELMDCYIDPAWKDFLKLVARWYKEGLIDREFANLTLAKSWEKIANGQVGAGVNNITYVGGDPARPPNSRVKAEELAAKKGAEVVILPPPIGPTGQQGARAYTPIGALGFDRQMFSKKVSDAKLAKILQIIDYARCGTLENWVYSLYGKPDVHFTWSGEPWKSTPTVKKPEEVPAGYPKQGGLGIGYPYWYTKENFYLVFSTKICDFLVDYLIDGPGQKFAIRPYRTDFFNETKFSEINAKVSGTLNTIVDEYYVKAIIGELDIDATWNDYVQRWRTNGGNDLLAELKKAPLAAELRKGTTKY